MLDMIFGSMYSTIPILIIGVVLLVVGAVYFAYLKRLGPFYWIGSIRAPYVRNLEGGHYIKVAGGDQLKEILEGGIRLYHSRLWNEKFPQDELTQQIIHKPTKVMFGLKTVDVAEFLPIARKGPGKWTRIEFKENEQGIIEEYVERKELTDAKSAFAVMEANNKKYAGEDLIEKYMPIISSFLMGIILFLTLIVMMQFLTSALGGHIAAMNANTAAMLKLANATIARAGGVPLPELPPG